MDYMNFRKFFARFPSTVLGDDIVMREMMLKDVEDYFNLMTHPEITRHESDEGEMKTIADAESALKNWASSFHQFSLVMWAIADAKTDKFIGYIGFNDWNFYNRKGEICYALDPKYHRRGIMKRALSYVISFAFSKMHLERINAKTMLTNPASRGLLEKLGFKQEGILRKFRYIRGKFEDITSYSLVIEDLNPIMQYNIKKIRDSESN